MVDLECFSFQTFERSISAAVRILAAKKEHLDLGVLQYFSSLASEGLFLLLLSEKSCLCELSHHRKILILCKDPQPSRGHWSQDMFPCLYFRLTNLYSFCFFLSIGVFFLAKRFFLSAHCYLIILVFHVKIVCI